MTAAAAPKRATKSPAARLTPGKHQNFNLFCTVSGYNVLVIFKP